MRRRLLDRARCVVLLSGGRDSVCLLDLAVRLAGRRVTALHVNYGLRESAGRRRGVLRATLCERLGVPLEVRARRPRPTGNLQAWARERALRGGAARWRRRRSPPATRRPTRSRPCSTGSPPRRAGARCSGCASATGGVDPPAARRSRARRRPPTARARAAVARGPDQRVADFARNRVRTSCCPALRALHPAAEANVLRTLALLRDEAEVLDDARRRRARRPTVARARARCRPRSRGWRCSGSPTMRRGAPVGARWTRSSRSARPAAPRRSTSAAACARSPSTGGCGSTRGTAAPPPPRRSLPVPGQRRLRQRRSSTCEAGRRRRRSTPTALGADARGPAVARRRPDAPARARRQPQSLQDLFTDRKVPRERRAARAGGGLRRRDRLGRRASPPASASRSRPATTRPGARSRWP